MVRATKTGDRSSCNFENGLDMVEWLYRKPAKVELQSSWCWCHFTCVCRRVHWTRRPYWLTWLSEAGTRCPVISCRRYAASSTSRAVCPGFSCLVTTTRWLGLIIHWNWTPTASKSTHVSKVIWQKAASPRPRKSKKYKLVNVIVSCFQVYGKASHGL